MRQPVGIVVGELFEAVPGRVVHSRDVPLIVRDEDVERAVGRGHKPLEHSRIVAPTYLPVIDTNFDVGLTIGMIPAHRTFLVLLIN